MNQRIKYLLVITVVIVSLGSPATARQKVRVEADLYGRPVAKGVQTAIVSGHWLTRAAPSGPSHLTAAPAAKDHRADPPPLPWFAGLCRLSAATVGYFEVGIFHDDTRGCERTRPAIAAPSPQRAPRRGPDPLALARRALERAVALAPEPALGTAPSELGLTGLATYVWLADPPGAITAVASASGITVSARAAPVAYVWDFGDGSEELTRDPGRPWTKDRPGSVAHTYQATDTYTITARVLWEASYRVEGGPLRPLGGFATTASTTLPVRQLQARLVGR